MLNRLVKQQRGMVSAMPHGINTFALISRNNEARQMPSHDYTAGVIERGG